MSRRVSRRFSLSSEPSLHAEVTGDGPTVVLVHAGIADSRMWDGQWRSFAGSHRVVRYDLRGYGRSPLRPGRYSHARDLVGVLEEVGPAAVVGVSTGGRAALEAAVARPELVTALVVAGAGLPDHDWSEKSLAFDADKEALAKRGDAEAYADANIRFWLDAGRSPDAVDARVRELVREMIVRSFELQSGDFEAERELLVPDIGAQLGEIDVPALVVVGEADISDIHTNADRLERDLPHAERAVIPGAAHLPPLERPEEFDRVVLDFLNRVREGYALRSYGKSVRSSQPSSVTRTRSSRRQPPKPGR